MGGTLTAEDTPGGGLTMTVSVPAVAQPGLPAASPAGANASAASEREPMTRVLVVDDEPQILRALRINLRVREYEVDVAATGTEALEMAARHPPDLVILDLGLPDLDGVEVIGGLRGWTKAPIIVLSGRADSTDKVEALDAGADDYITKPFGVEELLARMRAAVRRTGPAEDLPRIRLGDLVVDLAAKRVTRRAAGAGRGRRGPRRPGRRTTSGSPRPSGTCSRCCCATRASCSAAASC